jgi:hypothetical protein
MFNYMSVWSSTIAFTHTDPTRQPIVVPTESPKTRQPTVVPAENPTTRQPTVVPTESPMQTLLLGTPEAKWVKVGCYADGVYTEVIKDQVIGEMQWITNSSVFRELLWSGLFFNGNKLTGSIPLLLANAWEHTHSTRTINTYRCDYFDNLKPFNGGCMWRLEVSYGDALHPIIWMPHIVKCATLEPKCAPFIACANESCSECKKNGILSLQNTMFCV